ncbi:MAG TPA: PIN domain-containing protein [Casimicrobiaceae bacterium]|jgi:predicted nucleic acid-binding protein
MSVDDTFFDTNVVVYLFSADSAKADRAEEVLASGGQISVQVLNELVAVARRKLGMSWREILQVTAQLRAICPVTPLNVQTHERGLQIARRLGLSIYDGTIVASALLSGCATLYTEDMQDGRVIDGQLTIRNPFASKVI